MSYSTGFCLHHKYLYQEMKSVRSKKINEREYGSVIFKSVELHLNKYQHSCNKNLWTDEAIVGTSSPNVWREINTTNAL